MLFVFTFYNLNYLHSLNIISIAKKCLDNNYINKQIFKNHCFFFKPNDDIVVAKVDIFKKKC